MAETDNGLSASSDSSVLYDTMSTLAISMAVVPAKPRKYCEQDHSFDALYARMYWNLQWRLIYPDCTHCA